MDLGGLLVRFWLWGGDQAATACWSTVDEPARYVRVSGDGSEVELRVRPREGVSSGDDAADWELIE